MNVLYNISAITASNGPHSYLIGGIIALIILGYLIYTLVRPEKF
ncbi:MAG: potassium-transporting ATPase subunit F [Bacteroidales bacterium]|nr:potassium-transporting ATPase subunit F [Bacteroidales bacterium]